MNIAVALECQRKGCGVAKRGECGFCRSSDGRERDSRPALPRDRITDAMCNAPGEPDHRKLDLDPELPTTLRDQVGSLCDDSDALEATDGDVRIASEIAAECGISSDGP